MGEVADNNNNTLTKKKKKGRPSLLDLQKRALKQQQLLQRRNPDDEELRSGFRNPNSGAARSNRRNSNSDDDDDERRDKKHRLLHGLDSKDRRDSSYSKSDGCDLNTDASISRRNGSDDTVSYRVPLGYLKKQAFLKKSKSFFIWGKKMLI